MLIIIVEADVVEELVEILDSHGGLLAVLVEALSQADQVRK
jgi:hypothetical protein